MTAEAKLVATAIALAPDASGTSIASDSLWYRDAVVYELHIKAYADSNGDGIGDFRGLT